MGRAQMGQSERIYIPLNLTLESPPALLYLASNSSSPHKASLFEDMESTFSCAVLGEVHFEALRAKVYCRTLVLL